jgi:signal-transduction protein with cAMP-binding, CBS, and nucleotidyltransferase domain
MQVSDGMSEISVTVGPTHTLREAARRMVEHSTGAAIVEDAEAPAPGIVTERDLLVSVGAGEDPDTERVADHMTESVIAAAPDWSL